MKIDDVSSYHLIHELLGNGRAGIYPALEPILVQDIADAFEARTGQHFGVDAYAWMEWFLKEKNRKLLSKEDRVNLARVKQLTDWERKYIPLIEKERGEQKH